jgi:hypothetical protein
MLSWFVVFRFGARAFVMVLFGAVVVLFRVLRGSLNESYHKTSGLSLAGLVGIGSLYTSTEDLEGRIKKTAVNLWSWCYARLLCQ